MVKAFILSEQKQRVQIGDTIYNVSDRTTEKSQANRKGIFEECETSVTVPYKSLEAAQIALVLAARSPKRK